MPVRPSRPALRAAVLMGAASTLVVGALVGAQAAAASVHPVPGSTTTATPTMVRDELGCVARLTVDSRWPGGFVGSVRVANLNGLFAVETWTVTLTLPEGEVSHVWNGTLRQASPLVVTPAAWSPRVGWSGSAEFGFQGTGSADGATVSCVPLAPR